MALRKPSDFFGKEEEDVLPVVESDNSLREELSKVESLSEQLYQLQQELTQKVVKSDLESLVLSQIDAMHENFESLQKEFRQSNKNDLSKFKEIISEITETVNHLVENEIPKHKKEILSNEVRLGNQLKEFKEEVEDKVQQFYQVLNEFNDVVQVIDTVSSIEKYLQEHHQDLITLREEVFTEIQQIPVGNLQENLKRLEKKIDFIRETYSTIDPESVAKEIIQEGLLNEPPETKNEDPLTPLDRNFVTLDQLQEHYRLFINRIQQQLSTLGGGGETKLKYLDDIVGIATNPSAYNGKFLKYDHSIGKFVFATAGGGAGSQTLDDTLQLGNTSSLGMSVGVVTTPSINFTSGAILDDIYNDGGFGLKSAANQYATIASNNLQQFVVVDDTRILIGAAYTGDTNNYKYWNFDQNGNITFPDNTKQITAFVGYANTAGIATYAITAGVSTYASSSGISTYATTSGVSTYASTSGIATSAGTATTSTYLSSAANILTGTIAAERLSSSNAFNVYGDLFVQGNVSLGGTAVSLVAQELKIKDTDIVVGFTTDSLGNDISNETTANHGGVAVASTIGTPLVQFSSGIETTPHTYKKIMWFKNNSWTGLGTDAWLFNYGVGIGSTQVPNGVCLAAGAIQFTERDLSVVRNVNASGVITATTFVGNITGTATTATTVDVLNTNGLTTVYYPTFVESRTDGQIVRSDVDLTYRTDTNTLTVPNVSATTFTGALIGNATTANTAGYATTAGISTYATTAGISTNATTAGYATTAGISTVSQGLTGTPNITVGVITATDYRIQSVSEKTTLVNGNTVSLVYNTGSGNIAICTNPSGDVTLNVTGIPTDSNFDNRSITFSVIVNNTGTARSCTAVNLNGLSRTIKWFGGSLSAAISGVTTSSGYDIYNFTGINTVGSASTTSNYEVLGTVNGGYR